MILLIFERKALYHICASKIKKREICSPSSEIANKFSVPAHHTIYQEKRNARDDGGVGDVKGIPVVG